VIGETTGRTETLPPIRWARALRWVRPVAAWVVVRVADGLVGTGRPVRFSRRRSPARPVQHGGTRESPPPSVVRWPDATRPPVSVQVGGSPPLPRPWDADGPRRAGRESPPSRSGAVTERRRVRVRTRVRLRPRLTPPQAPPSEASLRRCHGLSPSTLMTSVAAGGRRRGVGPGHPMLRSP
jgi:hypothetical protein